MSQGKTPHMQAQHAEPLTHGWILTLLHYQKTKSITHEIHEIFVFCHVSADGLSKLPLSPGQTASKPGILTQDAPSLQTQVRLRQTHADWPFEACTASAVVHS